MEMKKNFRIIIYRLTKKEANYQIGNNQNEGSCAMGTNDYKNKLKR